MTEAQTPADRRVAVATPNDPSFSEAERLEYEIFRDCGFIGHGDSSEVSEYREYRSRSAFHIVSQDREIVGVVRTIHGSWNDLPLGVFRPTSALPEGELTEFASFAILPEWRSLGVAELLYRSVWRYGRQLRNVGVAAAVDQWLLDLLRNHYGWDFTAIGPPQEYMGGEVVPIFAAFGEGERRISTVNPTFWEFLTASEPGAHA